MSGGRGIEGVVEGFVGSCFVEMEEGFEGIFGLRWKIREKGFGKKKIDGMERVKVEGEKGGLVRGIATFSSCGKTTRHTSKRNEEGEEISIRR